ncbi:MAG: hypothetical protein HOC71_15255 [Candidatus Latescibacteria bacterium]|jgi:hypothetical protein|nr:hypothetical protein [Candidatus Latescibacterota bacterium]
MRFFILLTTISAFLCINSSSVTADTIMNGEQTSENVILAVSFPDMSEHIVKTADIDTDSKKNKEFKPAIWPFSKKNDSVSSEVKPKSTRKAFFLSFLLPGLGEAYVGSKRSILFLGVEAFAWWMYISNTNEGYDLEDDFQDFADTHWNYDDTNDSDGQNIDFNYFKWLQYHFREVGFSDDMDSRNHALIDSLLKKTVDKYNSSISGYSIHNLPPKKTQQYYEMIGKYPQFVYGWEDIDDKKNGGNYLNPTIRDENTGAIRYLTVETVKSPLRMKYETMRDNSNSKLKTGQRGIHIMLLNRVFSAIDAARLAYHHNKKLDSDLSMIRVRFTEKFIIDNKVPMIIVSKNF